MTKTRNRNQEDVELAAAEEWLDQLDPATTPAYDGAPHRRIIAAAKQLEDAEEGLRLAVAEARSGGYSWAMIGAALGTSRQAAQQRFAGSEEAPAKRAARQGRKHYGLAENGAESR